MSRNITVVKSRSLLFATIVAIPAIGAIAALENSSHVHAAPSAEAPVSVGVQTVNSRPVTVWSEFSGRTHAVDFAEIRPEVGGRITDVRIRDGQTVKAGDILFVIDPRPYEAAVAKARANLASAGNNAAFAKTDLERASRMVKSQAIAQRIYDESANTSRVADAAVQAADAALKQALIDLDHAYVKAPIGGRLSRAEVTLGNLVQPGAGAPVLTSVVSDNGIYVDFDVDERTYLTSVRSQANTSEKEQNIPVQVTLQGDDGHVYEGTVYSFDNRIDTATGTIRARAKLENKDGSLVPGMFVSVKLAGSVSTIALLVQERAIGIDQSKKFVYVVDDENKVAYHEVTLGQVVNGQRIVLTGLKSGDRVIIDGLQHVRPNAPVEPQQVAADQNMPKPIAN